MDVMKPELQWINGRCYRINPQDEKFAVWDNNYVEADEEELEEPPRIQHSSEYDGAFEQDDDGDTNLYDIIESNGTFKAKLDVASAYVGLIIGKRGDAKKRLESETRTQIKVPKFGDDSGIVISGRTRKDVTSACCRIDTIVNSARRRQPFTHFLSIPVDTDTVKQNMEMFKAAVLKECGNSRGIDESLFIPPYKLHLTLGMLVLLSNKERSDAVNLLSKCTEEIIGPLLKNYPLRVRMKGIEYMNDDPSEVDVLYGKLELLDDDSDSDRLQVLADSVMDFFVKKGTMNKEYEKVKLHVTLMNTKFRHEKSGQTDEPGRKNRRQARKTFDARKIFELYKSFEFGEITLKSLHISQRHSSDANGYYKCTSQVSLD